MSWKNHQSIEYAYYNFVTEIFGGSSAQNLLIVVMISGFQYLALESICFENPSPNVPDKPAPSLDDG